MGASGSHTLHHVPSEAPSEGTQPQTSQGAFTTPMVAIIKLCHDMHPYPQVSEEEATWEHCERLLKDPGRMACPFTERLGLPVCLVPSEPGQVLTPRRTTREDARRTNRYATRALTDPVSGRAWQDVLGTVYMLRLDGRSLTLDDFGDLDNAIYETITLSAMRGGVISDKMFSDAAGNLRKLLQQRQDRDGTLINGDEVSNDLLLQPACGVDMNKSLTHLEWFPPSAKS